MPNPPQQRLPEQLRTISVHRLLLLQRHGQLTADHTNAVAQAHGVNKRTVRRWMANARAHDGEYTPATRQRFTLTPKMRDTVARWAGNVTAAWRELKAEGTPVPSLAHFHRAVTRELSPGQRAGLRGGEKARRSFDVHPTRDRGFRNQAWEADHVEASVWVNVDGHRRKPWITWCIECATDGICGMAVTPQHASRESILLALRNSVLRDEYPPFGGIPTLIRVDGGKDYLGDAVDCSLSALGTDRVELIGQPWGKGTVEALNGAVKKMLFCSLPGYTDGHSPTRGEPTDPDERLLDFKEFVLLLQGWVHQWNHELPKRCLGGLTPAQAWEADLTPIYDAPPTAVFAFTLEAGGEPKKITPAGVYWRGHHYINDWMHGQVGRLVRIHYLPNHEHEIYLYDADSNEHLGLAYLAHRSTSDQRRALARARQREVNRLAAQLKRARRKTKERYAAVTVPTTPELLGAQTEEEALRELQDLRGVPLAEQPRPDFLPLPQPTNSWTPAEPASLEEQP